MGIFGKNEKTPEKVLVDEIWEEIKLTLSSSTEKIELNGIVEEAYKNGAGCDEIRRVYEEHLPKYQKKTDAEIERIKAVTSEPLTLKEKLAVFGFFAGLISFIALFIVLGTLDREIHFDEAVVDGLSFNVPHNYELKDLEEDAFFVHQRYEHEYRTRDKNGRSYQTYSLSIYVFKDNDIDQALSCLEFDDNWEIHRDITYGEYTGVRADAIVWPFKNTVPQWFIFEKDGKTAAVYLNNENIFKNHLVEIIG